MARTEADFMEYLRYGKEWEWRVYSLLRERFPALRPPKGLQKCQEYSRQSPDPSPDMALHGLPLECKRRKFHFTDASDYPYETFYIDEEYKLRDKVIPKDDYNRLSVAEKRTWIKPFLCYLTANADMTHMGLVIPASKTYWTLDNRRLTQDDRRGSSWACQLNKVLFMPVAEWRSILTWV
jgi:hypothetical protein